MDHVENILLADKCEEDPDSLDFTKVIKMKHSDRIPTYLQHVDNIGGCRPFSSVKERNHFEVPDESHPEKQPEGNKKQTLHKDNKFYLK